MMAAGLLCSQEVAEFIAPDPHMKWNQTIGLAIRQEFFDTLQKDVIIPGIMNLQSVLNDSIMKPWGINLDLFVLNGNLTYVQGNGTDVDNDTSIIRLYDDFLMFNLSRLVVDLELGYEFITEPAILADLGDLNFTLDTLSLNFNLTTFWVDKNISLNVTGFFVDLYDF